MVLLYENLDLIIDVICRFYTVNSLRNNAVVFSIGSFHLILICALKGFFYINIG